MKSLYSTIAAALLVSITLIASPAIAADGIAPPSEDETLIYVLREGRFAGGGAKIWIAVNDKTVARVKNKGYAVARVPAGRITLNLATTGIPVAIKALDDRPGETIYLRWRLGDAELREVDEADGQSFIKKAKQTAPIKELRPNNEEVRALLHIKRMGFDLMQPAEQRLEPDEDHAVLTLFRNKGKEIFIAGIYGQDGYTATLEAGQAIDVRLEAGKHYFLTGSAGVSAFTANVSAGKHYYAWLDIGTRAQLRPVTAGNVGKLQKAMDSAEYVELKPDAINDRLREREAIVSASLAESIAQIENGENRGNVLNASDSFD